MDYHIHSQFLYISKDKKYIYKTWQKQFYKDLLHLHFIFFLVQTELIAHPRDLFNSSQITTIIINIRYNFFFFSYVQTALNSDTAQSMFNTEHNSVFLLSQTWHREDNVNVRGGSAPELFVLSSRGVFPRLY